MHKLTNMSIGPPDQLVKAQVSINRAPVMTAWATVVCLRLNFSLEEALSLGQRSTSVCMSNPSMGLLLMVPGLIFSFCVHRRSFPDSLIPRFPV